MRKSGTRIATWKPVSLQTRPATHKPQEMTRNSAPKTVFSTGLQRIAVNRRTITA